MSNYENSAVSRQEEMTLTPLGTEHTSRTAQLPGAGEQAAQQVSLSDKMSKSIRSWGILLILWIIFSFVQTNYSWAVVLGIVCLMSFYFYDVAAMYLVYMGILLWASIWNILFAGDISWVGMAVIQIVFARLVYRDFRTYRNAKANDQTSPLLSESPAAKPTHREPHLAWLSLFLGLSGPVGLVTMIPASLVLYALVPEAGAELAGMVLGAMLEIGILGIPVGFAAISTRSHRKAATAGIVFGVISALVLVGSILMFIHGAAWGLST